MVFYSFRIATLPTQTLTSFDNPAAAAGKHQESLRNCDGFCKSPLVHRLGCFHTRATCFVRRDCQSGGFAGSGRGLVVRQGRAGRHGPPAARVCLCSKSVSTKVKPKPKSTLTFRKKQGNNFNKNKQCLTKNTLDTKIAPQRTVFDTKHTPQQKNV